MREERTAGADEVGASSLLDWESSQIFGEGSTGEEVQEGIPSSIHFPIFLHASLFLFKRLLDLICLI